MDKLSAAVVNGNYQNLFCRWISATPMLCAWGRITT